MITPAYIYQLKDQIETTSLGLFVSITPDEMIDLHPSDDEIIDSALYLIDEIYYDMTKKIRRANEQIKLPEIRKVRTVNDMCFNLARRVLRELWYAFTLPPDNEAKAVRICNVFNEIESLIQSICPHPEELE